MTELLGAFYGIYQHRKLIQKICITVIVIAGCFVLSLYLIVQTVFAIIQGGGGVVDTHNQTASGFSEFQSFSYKTINGEQWYSFNHPYSFPTLGSLTEGVIVDSSVNHVAWNISDPSSRQTEVKSFAVGTVLAVNDNILYGTTTRWKFCDESGTGICLYDAGTPANVQMGCGYEIKIQHADGLVTQYCHLATLPVLRVGDPVAVGQIIGVQGSTGWAKSKYLYFAMFRNGQPIDPSYAFTETSLNDWR
jgi:hypothetical protein